MTTTAFPNTFQWSLKEMFFWCLWWSVYFICRLSGHLQYQQSADYWFQWSGADTASGGWSQTYHPNGEEAGKQQQHWRPGAYKEIKRPADALVMTDVAFWHLVINYVKLYVFNKLLTKKFDVQLVFHPHSKKRKSILFCKNRSLSLHKLNINPVWDHSISW